ncbi:Predicted membrane protein [Micromonospora pattaloongensis]|uniref:Predicted membrane protein n=1 Tax=Micromonospora pattaloongensis TaxID=405436 RepID=A0A1H3M805_9ACTN|nr:DUF2339 domain-containing protein [Micromonospora pattaloongensis]SDY72706.1 Predicted membrane protein [Micromonospora pattaloongensis]
MNTYPCTVCGRDMPPAARCPYCGAEQGEFADELAAVERSIAEMKARDVAIANEQKTLAAKLQAAVFQRDILAHANAERLRRANRPRMTLRRRVGRRPPTAGRPGPPRARRPAPEPDPAAPSAGARATDIPTPPADPPVEPEPRVRPEASSREIQNVLLGLSALLLAVAAVVFAGLAVSSLEAASRVAILVAATVAMLAAAPVLARRSLISTAETVAAIGLLLVPLIGYAVWSVDALRGAPLSGGVFAGLIFAITAVIAGSYATATRLSVPRYATVVAVQPVLPLFAYDWIGDAGGWALALAVVAGIDLYLGRLFAEHGRLSPPGRVGAPSRRDAGSDATGAAEPVGVDRPESAPEETDAVVAAEPDGPRSGGQPPPAAAPPAPIVPGIWLRELIWTLHGVAIGAALVYAVAALLGADTLPAAARSALILLLAAVVALAGALSMGHRPLPDIAAGVLTLAVIGSVARVAAVALPGHALLIVAAVVTVTGLAVRAIPDQARRGPQLASAAALAVLGTLVAGSALRAALASVRAAQPVWEADLAAYPGTVAAAAGPIDWQLAVAALLLTVAAVLALPPAARRESAVAGAALTALAVPAAFALPWYAAPWPPALAAAGIGAAGLFARTERAAYVHAAGAAIVGFAAAGAALVRPGLTAGVLIALATAGVLIALAARLPEFRADPPAETMAAWAAGATAFALPGAVAALVAATTPAGAQTSATAQQAATVSVLAASFLAVCATLGYAAVTQVAERQISLPLTLGTGLGALLVAGAAFAAPGATVADTWVGALLLAAAVLLFLAPTIDAGRRADRLLDGPDFAAAAATAALVGTLARIAAIVVPGIELAATAALVLLVAVAVRAMPEQWRRGPVLGAAVSGGVVALIAGYAAVGHALRALATPGPLWNGDLGAWPVGAGAVGWQVPGALVLLAVAAAVLLPRPWSYDVSGALAALATVATPVALGLPWWSPILVGSAVTVVYALAGVAAADPRAGLSRTVVAGTVALFAAGGGLVRPWTTAAALAVVTLLGAVVATLARVLAGLPDEQAGPGPRGGAGDGPAPPTDLMPAHLAQIGGPATGGALLALPGAVAAFAAQLGWPAAIVLTSALAASCTGIAVLALARQQVPHYLPYATVGIVGGATVTGLAALPTALPAGLYAAGATLLGVLAELLRANTTPPGGPAQPAHHWSALGPAADRLPPAQPQARWLVSPGRGVVVATALPTALAAVAIAPALLAALVGPYQVLGRIWQGPPPELLDPPRDAMDPTNVLAALLLTVAAALAATGFSGSRASEAVPVVLPGVAITLLIAPISLGRGWPDGTMAALAVFTIAMLGLALTPPPPDTDRARPARIARVVVFVIGLAAGGAGLVGSLATRPLTLFTLGGAVAVGAVAAYFGRAQNARILGWLFAAVMAQLFVLTVGLVAGLPPTTSAFGVLAVGAALLVTATRLPRLRRPEAVRESAVVEWSGYAAALLALALAFDSPRHVAALLAAWGAVLGVVATRPGRQPVERRVIFWAAVACEITAWWLLMALSDVALTEAYTLPFAALALLVGVLELRYRPDLSSWTAYGPALLAAFVPTLVIVLATNSGDLRQLLLLLGAVATLIAGSMRQQQAPVVVGAIVTAITAIHVLTLVGPWLALIPVGIVLLALGATNERRRRTQERLRGALRGLR